MKSTNTITYMLFLLHKTEVSIFLFVWAYPKTQNLIFESRIWNSQSNIWPGGMTLKTPDDLE